MWGLMNFLFALSYSSVFLYDSRWNTRLLTFPVNSCMVVNSGPAIGSMLFRGTCITLMLCGTWSGVSTTLSRNLANTASENFPVHVNYVCETINIVISCKKLFIL